MHLVSINNPDWVVKLHLFNFEQICIIYKIQDYFKMNRWTYVVLLPLY